MPRYRIIVSGGLERGPAWRCRDLLPTERSRYR